MRVLPIVFRTSKKVGESGYTTNFSKICLKLGGGSISQKNSPQNLWETEFFLAGERIPGRDPVFAAPPGADPWREKARIFSGKNLWRKHTWESKGGSFGWMEFFGVFFFWGLLKWLNHGSGLKSTLNESKMKGKEPLEIHPFSTQPWLWEEE